MITQILSGDYAVALGADLIKQGEIVAFPTETVYGLGANALDEFAVKKIFTAKGRPSDNPLIVHISNIEQLYKCAEIVPDIAKKIINKFMPGAITIILKKNKIIPDCVTAGLDTVGIRMPNHKIALQLIEKAGVPICAPSANISTRVSCTEAKDVFDDLKGRVPLVIDGGNCTVGIESTIIDLTGDVPTILRPGGITAEMLADVIGYVEAFKGEVIGTAPAPGMKYKHYSPLVDMILVKNIQILSGEYDKKSINGVNPIAIVVDTIENRLILKNKNAYYIKEDEIAVKIYSILREVEKKYDYIICQYFGDSGINASVMNRLIKASGDII